MMSSHQSRLVDFSNILRYLSHRKEKNINLDQKIEYEADCFENCSCGICLETIEPLEYATTDCHHIYHHDCIRIWLNTSKTCPTCRRQVTKCNTGILDQFCKKYADASISLIICAISEQMFAIISENFAVECVLRLHLSDVCTMILDSTTISLKCKKVVQDFYDSLENDRKALKYFPLEIRNGFKSRWMRATSILIENLKSIRVE